MESLMQEKKSKRPYSSVEITAPEKDDDDVGVSVVEPHLSAPEEPKRKKSKSATGPPPYGSHEYWETRYRSQFQKIRQGKEVREDSYAAEPWRSASDSDDNAERADDTLPFHSWYFSYDELRVLLLPLILGGRKEAFTIVSGDDDDQESDGDDSLDGTPGGEGNFNADEGNENHLEAPGRSRRRDTTKAISNLKENEGQGPPRCAGNGDDAGSERDDSTGSSTVETNGARSEDKEEEDDDKEEGDDEEEGDEEEDREGLAKDGPVSILEVGCGDVPICVGLLQEVVRLSKATGVAYESIIARLVATDYSSVVIDAMKVEHEGCEAEGSVLQFEAVDARKLPYPDGSFHLVLEKGVLDAMLSDTEEGSENCIRIVRECGRVLSAGGVIVLISHLNANTSRGMRWLEDIVFVGLANDDGPSFDWEVEVHGSDGGGGREISDESKDAQCPGPAVYIIHKKQKVDAAGSQAFPLKFFVY